MQITELIQGVFAPLGEISGVSNIKVWDAPFQGTRELGSVRNYAQQILVTFKYEGTLGDPNLIVALDRAWETVKPDLVLAVTAQLIEEAFIVTGKQIGRAHV